MEKQKEVIDVAKDAYRWALDQGIAKEHVQFYLKVTQYLHYMSTEH